MRTRIALVAIIPVALITTLVQAATVQTAHAIPVPVPSSVTNVSTPGYRPFNVLDPSSLVVGLGATLARPPVTTALPFTAPPSPAAPAAPAGPVTATPVAVTAPAPAPPAGPVDTVTPEQRAAWERVAMCEEGGNWASNGPRFSGGLGITRSNWISFGGGQYAPEAAMATPDQQIMVAERIQFDPPDQYGCGSW